MSRTSAFTTALALATLVLPAAAVQDKPASGKVPDRGSQVVAEGCLQGATLRSAELTTTDTTGTLATPLTYQLKGDKGLLKRLRDEHDGRVVRVTAILKSQLPDNERHAKKIGNTTISLGIRTTSPREPSSVHETSASLPVLEVASYEGLGTHCG
jgi:hypothetical protein